MFDIDPRLREFLLERNDEDLNGPLMPTHVIVVAEYLDEDGDARWSSHCEGNGQVSGAIGLLEFGEGSLVGGDEGVVVRYFTPSPFWRRFTRWHWQGLRLAKQAARMYRDDPTHRARLIEAIRRAKAGETEPLDLNQLRLRWGLRDRNPFPVIRFVRWLP